MTFQVNTVKMTCLDYAIKRAGSIMSEDVDVIGMANAFYNYVVEPLGSDPDEGKHKVN